MKTIISRLFVLFCVLLLSSISYGQTPAEDFGKSLYNVINRNDNKTNFTYKEVLNEIVVINSASSARFSGGNSRQGIKVRLPLFTTKWCYRITLMDAYGSYSYQSRESLYSLLSNGYPLFVNNQINFGIDFYIIDDFSINNFTQTGNDNFRYIRDFSKEKTIGFYGECNLTQNNLWIGLRNNNITQGIKAIVEVVAFGKFN